ncbi:MAG TPA: GatB/YqeY domain-containing protein [Mycobacteriales bacterium]
MADLKSRLHADLTAAMKARDELTTATLRMVLAAVTTEEVAGRQARELSDDEVMRVLAREAKKRREAAEAFDAGSRAELAARERAEGEVVARYLPTPLSDEELAQVVRQCVTQIGATGMAQMGQVIKAVQAVVGNRADGRRIADEVRHQLAG